MRRDMIALFVNGQWQSVSFIIDNWTFNAVGYDARKGSPAEITVNCEIFHGSDSLIDRYDIGMKIYVEVCCQQPLMAEAE